MTNDDTLSHAPISIFSQVKIDDGYVRAICRKFIGKGVDFDELYSLAQDGILRAAELYNPDHNSKAKFQTYATVWIRERILQRFKDMKREETHKEHLRNTAPLYTTQMEHEPIDIPDDLFFLFLGHIQECTENVMESDRATTAMYGELLSAGEKYPYSENVMQTRREMEALLYPIIQTFLQSPVAIKIYMSRFGAQIIDFAEIGSYRAVSSQRACAEFASICSKVIWACNDPTMQTIAQARYKKAVIDQSKPVLQ